MAAPKSPRKGSLQYWPRKRASKFLPRVNWDVINSKRPIKGFIGYKAGMMTAMAKENTPDSMTKGREVAIPVTILECPKMKIFSVRFYKNKLVAEEILMHDLDNELKKKIKLPKKTGKKLEDIKLENYDNISIIVYTLVKKTNIKKTPDLLEIGLSGTKEEKMKFVKDKIGKELSIYDFFEKNQLVDLRGLTKGKGLQGPVKRFGVTLKSHKSEKGRRRPGSLGPWHPHRVTYRIALAGQIGLFTRVLYNNKIIDLGKSEGKFKGIKNFGDIKTDYLVIRGSVQGPAKRQLIISESLRPTKKQLKKSFELISLK